MNGKSCGNQNEAVPVQARDSTHSHTVAENGQVLPTFVPQEDQAAKGYEQHAGTNHACTSVSHI